MNCAGPVYSALPPLTYDVYTCVTEHVSVNTTNITANSFTLNWFAPIGGNALPITYTIEVATDPGFTTPVLGSPFSVLNPTISLTRTRQQKTASFWQLLWNLLQHHPL